VKGGTQLGAHFRLSYTFVCSEPVEGPPYPQAGGKGPRVYLGASYTVVGVSRRVDGWAISACEFSCVNRVRWRRHIHVHR